ncbi:MAG TPA: hypothetical protein VLT47_06600 [Anaeromyxobacteraceae bacterium]|nr:hypothetical protein [Anaeromyxobacteraceae bacterium]
MRPPVIALLVPLALLVPDRPRCAEPAAPTPPTAAPSPDLKPRPDLDLLLSEPPATVRDRAVEEAVQRRRTLLNVHQAAGLATWGLMAATVVVGQLNYNDLYGGGGYTQRYRETHVALAGATTASFAFTGVLAFAAPKPYPTRPRLDTATVHKVSMALTTLGIVSQIALGYVTHDAPAGVDQRRLAQAHQGVGYATLGAMTIGAVTLLF